jgi:hypothetical protein
VQKDRGLVDRSQTRGLTGEDLRKAVGIAFDGKAGVMAVARADGQIDLMRPETGEALVTLSTGSTRLTAIAMSVSGHWIAAGDTHGRLFLWDLAKLRSHLESAGIDWSPWTLSKSELDSRLRY